MKKVTAAHPLVSFPHKGKALDLFKKGSGAPILARETDVSYSLLPRKRWLRTGWVDFPRGLGVRQPYCQVTLQA